MHSDRLCRRCHEPLDGRAFCRYRVTFAYFEATREYLARYGMKPGRPAERLRPMESVTSFTKPLRLCAIDYR